MKKIFTLIIALASSFAASAQLTGDDVTSYPGTQSALIADSYGPYVTEDVIYEVSKYVEGGVEYVDVAIPTTICNIGWAGVLNIGNLTIGSYTVTHLQYDESQGGYYKDYSNDGLTMYVKSDGVLALDKDYDLTGDILLTYVGNDINVVSNPQPGSMPLSLTISFQSDVASGIGAISNDQPAVNSSDTFNLAGQKISKNSKGLVIVNGKKVVR